MGVITNKVTCSNAKLLPQRCLGQRGLSKLEPINGIGSTLHGPRGCHLGIDKFPGWWCGPVIPKFPIKILNEMWIHGCSTLITTDQYEINPSGMISMYKGWLPFAGCGQCKKLQILDHLLKDIFVRLTSFLKFRVKGLDEWRMLLKRRVEVSSNDQKMCVWDMFVLQSAAGRVHNIWTPRPGFQLCW